jgi:hypothetical protein
MKKENFLSFIKMDEYLNGDKIVTLKGATTISKEEFIDALSMFNVNYANGGNSTNLTKEILYGDFIKNNLAVGNQDYVFHNILLDNQLFDLINNMIPVPKTNKRMRISRLYTGSEGSGTNLHTHTVAINYLVSGKKMWIMFPDTFLNSDYVMRNKFNYPNIKIPTVTWYDEHAEDLHENIEGLEILMQYSGDAIIVPHGYYHAVINFEESFGITYSWY